MISHDTRTVGRWTKETSTSVRKTSAPPTRCLGTVEQWSRLTSTDDVAFAIRANPKVRPVCVPSFGLRHRIGMRALLDIVPIDICDLCELEVPSGRLEHAGPLNVGDALPDVCRRLNTGQWTWESSSLVSKRASRGEGRARKYP
jgi:hypothetical protein